MTVENSDLDFSNVQKAEIKTVGKSVNREVKDITYTLSGKGDIVVNGDAVLEGDNAFLRPEACAREVVSSNTEKYYIKMNNRGMLYDPHDKSMVMTQGKKDMGMNIWRMAEVKKAAFFHYLRFLKSHNKAEFNLARRSI